MRLLLLAALRAQTGNGTTARRIQHRAELTFAPCVSSSRSLQRDHLDAAGHSCVLKDVSCDGSPSAILDLIASENFKAALGIHLYKAGRLLQGCRIPFGIVFGGTDINEDVASDEKCRVMGAVLDEARFAVSFTEAMKEKAIMHWPHARNKIYVQGQGIVTAPSASLNWKTFLQSAG
ncbi:hypothetical protein lerEdw1_000760, partial [Lerista edwardsae]